MWRESVWRSSRMWGGVGRLRRALFILAVAACCAAGLLYWRQQSDQQFRRPMHAFYSGIEPQWSWHCRNDRCERIPTSDSSTLQSLQTCNMLCTSTQLWPQPTGPVTLASSAVSISADVFQLQIVTSPSAAVTEHLKDAFLLMRNDLRKLERSAPGPPLAPSIHTVSIRVSVNGSADPRLRLDTDESYKLTSDTTNNAMTVFITAKTFCGARHGFETLSQLIWLDPYAGGGTLLMLEAVMITDKPKFHYRGLLLDTARNYFSVSDILRTIDAMGANKLNTFHWHATDSQSFPLKLNSAPQLAEHGAYGPSAVYTTDDIKAIVRRASLRGIRVLIEVDAPAHVGRAWDWGPAGGLGQLAYCVETEPWSAYCGEPPCGQLNPRNENVYDLLEKIYKEIIDLTGVDDIFHLGGDEVSERCWTVHFNESDPMELWMDFTNRAMNRLQRANGGKLPELTMLWSSRLTRSPYLERLDAKHVGIQVWGASHWPESRAVLDAGFRTIISHVDAWYLDCGFGSWRDSTDGHCGPYRSWQQVYEHRPWVENAPSVINNMGATPNRWRIEGGAACQWTEQLGPGGLDPRVWPRTSALAERLWSDRGEGAAPDVYLRLDTHRTRLLARGIHSAPLWPRWCTHNPSACL